MINFVYKRDWAEYTQLSSSLIKEVGNVEQTVNQVEKSIQTGQRSKELVSQLKMIQLVMTLLDNIAGKILLVCRM